MSFSKLSQLIIFFFVSISALSNYSAAHNSGIRVIKRRTLMGFKETPNGGNLTFDCSPSGPCIPCSRSEKNDEKYRCSETGYRIRLKCQPTGTSSKKEKSQKLENGRSDLETEQITISTRQRSLLDDSSKSKGGSNFYITYRSCIPAVNEEKLSVLDFEAIMMVLLISSGSFIYYRRKRSSSIQGAVRIPTSFRKVKN
ncbi:unnamed protein product [Fraxinus pennsylvanica]|uniref:Uncharacterized protein n=1 Tax=Fraxinus pennsylvanica TaxID=56036 RepID=A0AAD1ZW07_9LAMI|nr:unnamed protein product [Fraxinus pennsylvanica]